MNFISGLFLGMLGMFPLISYWMRRAQVAEENLREAEQGLAEMLTLPLPAYDGSKKRPKHEFEYVEDDRDVVADEIMINTKKKSRGETTEDMD